MQKTWGCINSTTEIQNLSKMTNDKGSQSQMFERNNRHYKHLWALETNGFKLKYASAKKGKAIVAKR